MEKNKTGFAQELLDKAYRLAAHKETKKADIEAGDGATWLVVTTIGGQERVAAAHLIGRRFAIYLPEKEVIERGKRRIEFMFPGHLFLFAWGPERQWTKIKACPGVIDILGYIGDHDIRAVQQVENERYPIISSVKIGKHKRYRRSRREDTPEYSAEVVTVRMWSAFTDGLADDLDSAARNQLLHRAMSLSSS